MTEPVAGIKSPPGREAGSFESTLGRGTGMESFKEKILFVDDDSHALSALVRQYQDKFQTDVAVDVEQGLKKIFRGGDYAVVVGGLDLSAVEGMDFFSLVEKASPRTIRIALVDCAEEKEALKAVGEGRIFQFLAKPCRPISLAKTLGAAIRKYRQTAGSGSSSIKEALAGFLGGLAGMIESKDRYAAGHQQRVSRLCVAIGRQMGLDSYTLDNLRLASLAHDIGMIGVPLEILTKAAPLSDAEMELIRCHCRIGRDLLEPFESHWPLAEIVYQHHERLDGSGYPDGLVGDDIRLEARVLAVADVMDAMRSDRPYRPALPDRDIFWEIEVHKGTLYDPRVVQACLDIVQQGKGFGPLVGGGGKNPYGAN